MHKSTGHKLYGVLFSLLSGKSSSPPSPLLLPSPLLQSTYIKDWNIQSCTKARSPKTVVTIIPLFWVPSPTGKVTISCDRDTVNIKAVYCHLWSSIFDISIQKKKKGNPILRLPAAISVFKRNEHMENVLRLKYILESGWSEVAQENKQTNKNICLQEEKKNLKCLASTLSENNQGINKLDRVFNLCLIFP